MIRLLAPVPLLAVTLAFAADPPVPPAAAAVTYHKHVAPILQNNCQGCHRPGEVGPFPLTTYKEARKWAADITTYTASRQMPPWMPAGGVPMKGERKLAAADVATLARWEAAGCPEGDPADAPPPARYPDGWRLGKPDLVLSTTADFHLAAAGKDIFRCFVIPTGLTEDKWVIGYDVKPGNPRVVHHTQHFFDTSGTAREMERKHRLKEEADRPADHGPGYPTTMGVGFVTARTAKGPAARVGSLGGWVPGQNLDFLPAGTGWRLPKGSDFILYTHYHRDGKPSADRTRVGLYFARGPIDQPWQMVVINGMKPWERIPAGKADYLARGTVYLHTDALLHGVMPHMHLLGKTVKVAATPPGGKPIVLIDIPAWDYRWQEGYLFQKPLPAKAGTKLEVEVVFDNSAANPNNPHSPPKEVAFGEQTTDEMLYTFIGATSPKTPYERVQTYPYPPAEGPGVPGGKLTPVLERRVGTWDTTLTLKFGAAPPLTFTGRDVVETAAGGTFIRGKASPDAGGMTVITQATYDPARKAYRLWLYDTHGTAIELAGTYDGPTKTLTWTAVPQAGMEAKVVWTDVAADKSEWSGKVTTGGKPVLEVSATMTRKK